MPRSTTYSLRMIKVFNQIKKRMVSRFFTIQLPDSQGLDVGNEPGSKELCLKDVHVSYEPKSNNGKGSENTSHENVTVPPMSVPRSNYHIVGFWSTFAVSYTLIIFCIYMLLTRDKCDTSEYMSLLSTCIAIWIPSPSHIFKEKH